MAHLQDRVPLQQVNDEEQQARELLAQAGYVGMVGKNTYSKTQGVCPSPSISLHSFFLMFICSHLGAQTTWTYGCERQYLT